MNLLQQQLTDRISNLEPTLVTPKAKALLKEIKNLTLRHRASVALEARRLPSRTLEDSAQYFEAELHPIGDAVRKNLGLLIEHKQERFLLARNQADRAISKATALIVAVALLAIVMASVLAFIISHTVSRLHSQVDKIAKKREEALALLGTWLEASPAGLSFLDSSLRFIRANKQFASALGITDGQILGREISQVLPPSLFEIGASAGASLNERRAILDVPLNGATAAGRDLLISYYPVCIEGDASVGVGIVLVDVTQLKQLECDLQRLGADLRRSNLELEQFAAVASHDLREPLRTIRCFLQLLDRKYGAVFDAEAKEYIRFATEGAGRLSHLVEALLEYSRAGSHPLKRERVLTGPLLQNVLHNLKTALDEKNARVELQQPLPSTIEGDPALLEQLFQNLVSNAVKYCNDGPPKIEISAVAQGASCEFLVRDHGIGFPPEEAQRIFEVFRRLHGKGEYGGAGIGLAVCKRIVERHRGRIWAESTPGEGSTFHFTLPAIELVHPAKNRAES